MGGGGIGGCKKCLPELLQAEMERPAHPCALTNGAGGHVNAWDGSDSKTSSRASLSHRIKLQIPRTLLPVTC
jgi:hypothetical protein